MIYNYSFDQLRNIDENRHLLFLYYESAVKNFGPIDQSRYSTVDYGTIDAKDERAACEKLYLKYNTDERPAGYEGRSMSVSDIVTLWDNSTEPPCRSSWFCDRIGFKRLED